MQHLYKMHFLCLFDKKTSKTEFCFLHSSINEICHRSFWKPCSWNDRKQILFSSGNWIGFKQFNECFVWSIPCSQIAVNQICSRVIFRCQLYFVFSKDRWPAATILEQSKMESIQTNPTSSATNNHTSIWLKWIS